MSEIEMKNDESVAAETAVTPVAPKPGRDWTGIWLLVVAVVLVCPYCVVSVLGWREFTSYFSGTFRPADPQGIRGVGFAVAYFVAWVGTPIFGIAAGFCGLEWGIRRMSKR